MALRSKLLSALCASALQNVSSVFGSHSLSEAVYLASLSLFRLISLFHVFYTSFILRAAPALFTFFLSLKIATE